MREIKFRVWDNETNHMIYPEKTFDPGHHSFNMHSGTLQYYNLQNGYGTGEMMQYTGLKDKNGKEIYEGDVLKAYGKEIAWYVVSYSDGSFRLHHHFGVWGLLSRLFEMVDMPADVIGNIHENPELLIK